MKDPRPAWIEALDEDDLQFLKRFVLTSGSLKALCDEYGVSYPTVRARLDRLIAKVQAVEVPSVVDPFQKKLQVMVAEGKMSTGLARELWKSHRAAVEERNGQ